MKKSEWLDANTPLRQERKSILSKYKKDIFELYFGGYSVRQIQSYLKEVKNFEVKYRTLCYYCTKKINPPEDKPKEKQKEPKQSAQKIELHKEPDKNELELTDSMKRQLGILPKPSAEEFFAKTKQEASEN